MSKMPKEFHFVYGLKKQTQPFHLAHFLCLESCYQVNKPEKIYFYYHHQPYGKYWDLIKEKIMPVKVELIPFVSKYKHNAGIKKYLYAHHADFLRLQILLENGGVYADIDTLFVNEVPLELYSKPFVLGQEDDICDQATKAMQHSLCNAFIMSEKGAEFGRLWLENLTSAYDGSWSNHSTLLPYNLSKRYPSLIHVEPAHSFYPFMWTAQDFNRLFTSNERLKENVVSIHLWSHLWWSKKRRDFSDFHAGLINEEQIRNIDTTYNVAARKFLPKASGEKIFYQREKNNPLISIIIPTFNRPKFLKSAVNSVLKQIYHHYEIIIINDGSEDCYKEQLDAICALSPAIRIVHCDQNAGPSAARNIGLSRSKGEYVCFLDDDDLLHPNMLASGLSYFTQNQNIDMVACRVKFIYDSSCPYKAKELIKNQLSQKMINHADFEKKSFLTLLDIALPIHSCLIKKASIEDVRFSEDMAFGEDRYFWLCLVLRGCRIKCNNAVYAYIRKHKNNRSAIMQSDLNARVMGINKLLANNLLKNRQARFLIYGKLFLRYVKAKRASGIKYIFPFILAPDLLFKYTFLYIIRKYQHGAIFLENYRQD